MFRSSCYHLLLGLVLVLVSAPFVQSTSHGPLVEAILMTLVLLSAVLAVGGRHRMLAVGGVLAAPAFVTHWVVHAHPGLMPAWVASAAATVPLGFVMFILFRFVLQAKRVNAEVICASVSNYLLLGLSFALGYKIAAGLMPGAFTLSGCADPASSWSSFTFFYFSFITLCTVGYGDIIPNLDVTRMLAMVEAMVGTFYMAILVARLVAMYSFDQSAREKT